MTFLARTPRGAGRASAHRAAGLLWLLGFLVPAAAASAGAVPVVATTPDLGALAEELGGEEVDATVLVKGPQDPHALQAKPTFIRALHRAGLYLQVGLELEVAWAPALLRTARNAEIQPGARGFLDASEAITPREVPRGTVDRSRGDIHVLGNPHYLLDPLNGLRVARSIRDKLVELRPEKKSFFEERFAAFERRLVLALLGKALLEKYAGKDVPKLLLLLERGGPRRFVEFLEKEGQVELLGGWLAAMRPHFGAKVVADHNVWPYFAERFGIEVAGLLEPKPGISPTSRHLAELIRKMESEGVRAILSSPYFDGRHAELVSRHTDAPIVEMAHQVGARAGMDGYLEMVDHNVRQLTAALGESR